MRLAERVPVPDMTLDDYLRQAIAEGKSARRIALDMGCSIQGVINHLRRLNARPIEGWMVSRGRGRKAA